MKNFRFLFVISFFLSTSFLSGQNFTDVDTYAGSGSPGLVNAGLLTSQFQNPYGLCSDSLGNIYVADTYNNCIRKITGGFVTTVAGNGTVGDVDAQGANARFDHPTGVFYKNSYLYICDNYNNKIKKMDAAGNVTTIAGSGAWSYQDGTVMQAAFKEPKSITVDNNGTVYVADYENHCIRKIAGGMVTTYAGVGGVAGDNLGASSTAKFWRPRDVVLDPAGNLYVTDLMNNKIKVITPGGIVNLVAGSGAQGGTDGLGIAASFDRPCGIDIRQNGDLIVIDAVGPRIRTVTQAGLVTTIAGYGASGYFDGPVFSATFNLPQDICYDLQGSLYISDDLNHVIRVLVNINPKGFDEFYSNSFLTLFPNPSNNEVLIKSGDFPINTISIFDAYGKLCKTIAVVAEPDEIRISIAELSAGEYLIVTDGEKGRAMGKLMKE